jgi:hypothetical protein
MKCIQKVIRIDQPHGDNPPKIPMECVNYHSDLCEYPVRTDLKPLNIIQPEGGSWTIKGKTNICIDFMYIYMYVYTHDELHHMETDLYTHTYIYVYISIYMYIYLFGTVEYIALTVERRSMNYERFVVLFYLSLFSLYSALFVVYF